VLWFEYTVTADDALKASDVGTPFMFAAAYNANVLGVKGAPFRDIPIS
jgi:hypothetical protein